MSLRQIRNLRAVSSRRAVRLRTLPIPAPSSPPPPTLWLGEVRIDEAARGLHGPRGRVRLTRTEWLLLRYLLDNYGQVVTREAILAEVWGAAYIDGVGLLHDAVSRLRRRFLAAGATADPIETLYGVGYCLLGPPPLSNGRSRRL